MKTYDAIIVGAGQAGPPLAERLSNAGQTVALVERKLFGGTCVNTGCMPTKTLVASAAAAHLARRAADFGVTIEGGAGAAITISVDMKAVHDRAMGVATHARHGVESWLAGMKNCTVYRGHARFESAKEISVEGDRLTAEKIFLDVGGRARVPKLPGVETIEYLTNRSILDLDVLPEHLVVIGGSYIGLEFAQMYRRFGSRVTVVEMGPRIASKEDEDVSAAIQKILEAEGIAVRLHAACIHFEARGTKIAVGLECAVPSSVPELVASHVLLAVGREPNTGDLGVEKAGLSLDERGYFVVGDDLQTNVPGIYAMGDCNGKGAFTHTSYNDFEIVAANLLDGQARKVSDRILGYALYIDPPLGRVGMTETEARKSGKKIKVGQRPMTRVGRAIEKSETQGFMKIIVDAENDAILGAHILGVGGDEAIHGILDMMNAKVPYTTLQHAVPIHPTVSELIPTMLGDLKD